jgi:glyoxylase-like metal-dependent hydrolase (beta-lactamase superfamily II)
MAFVHNFIPGFQTQLISFTVSDSYHQAGKTSMDVYPITMRMQLFQEDTTRSLPLMAAVVHTGSQWIMIDTGLADKPSLFDQLKLIHLSPIDFDLVINTHVHPDHVGNNLAFSRAKIIVSKVDYEFQKNYSNAMISSSDPVQVLHQFYPEFRQHRAPQYAAHAQQLARRAWRDDLLGRPDQIKWIEENPSLPPGIGLIHTPGHTPGHYAVHLQSKPDQSAMLISGDAMPSKLFYKKNLRENAPRYDNQLYEQSKKQIESHQGIIMGGHDRPFRTDDLRYIDANPILLERK